jgi:multisubunit Na+/H+ antiporter MnhF subunit
MAPNDMPAGGYVSDYLAFWGIWILVVAGTWAFFRLTKGRTGRARLVAGNLLVLLALAWTVVVAAETYLRYVYDATDSYGLMMTNRAWFIRHVKENSDGLRDVEFTKGRRPGVVKVACVGDSFTMGWGVHDPEDAFPQRIRAKLAERFPGRFEVRNYGVPGYTTGHELSMIEKLARDGEIDHVILGYCLNDPDDLLPQERWFIREAQPRVPYIRPSASFVADFLWFRFKLQNDPHVRGYFDWEKEAYEDQRIFRAQCERFARIAEVCRAAQMRLDVVTFPMFSDWGESYRYHAAHDKLAEAWRQLGVNDLDLRDAYRGVPREDLVINRFDGHPNVRAQEIAAWTILDRIFGVR